MKTVVKSKTGMKDRMIDGTQETALRIDQRGSLPPSTMTERIKIESRAGLVSKTTSKLMSEGNKSVQECCVTNEYSI